MHEIGVHGCVGTVTPCCLPSGLSPSALEFHQINRPCEQDRVADYHRRFGITPTPEHVRRQSSPELGAGATMVPAGIPAVARAASCPLANLNEGRPI